MADEEKEGSRRKKQRFEEIINNRIEATPFSVTIPNTATTAATAFDITSLLPLDGVCNLTGLANPQTIWLKYTLQENDFALSIWGSSEGSLYKPEHYYYLGIPANPDTGFFQSGNTYHVEGFIESTVGVPQTGTIYIRIKNRLVGTPTLSTTIYVKKLPNVAVPVNSLIINNDIDGFAATILSPTGTPTQMRSFAAGESGEMLSNGISLWSDHTNHNLLHLYDANMVLITTLTWASRINLRDPIGSNRVDKFWVGAAASGPTAKINTVTSAGVLGTEFSIANFSLQFAAPSFVNSNLLYVCGTFFTTPYPYGIWRYNLATSTLEATPFITNESGYNMVGFYGREFIVLADDSILVMKQKTSAGASKLTLFSSTGVSIRDYVLDFNDVNRICLGSDETTVWVWTFDNEFDSQFIEFRISDGVRLHNFTRITTSEGVGFSSFPTSFADELFGVPECCPLVISRTAIPTYGNGDIPPEVIPGAGIYELVPGKRNDTIYTEDGEMDVKIPNPRASTTYIGS